MNALQLRWLSERGRVDRTECSLQGMLKRVPDWGRESRRGPGYGWSCCPATVCRSDVPVATLQNRGSCRSDVPVATGFARIQASGRRREAPPYKTGDPAGATSRSRPVLPASRLPVGAGRHLLQNRGSCRSDVPVATGFARIQASGRRREAPPTKPGILQERRPGRDLTKPEIL